MADVTACAYATVLGWLLSWSDGSHGKQMQIAERAKLINAQGGREDEPGQGA